MAGRPRLAMHVARLVVLAVLSVGLSTAAPKAPAGPEPAYHLVSAGERWQSAQLAGLPPFAALQTPALRLRNVDHRLAPLPFWLVMAQNGPEVRLAVPAVPRPPRENPGFNGWQPRAALDSVVRFEFSEPMDTHSVERAFRIEPAVAGTFEWPDPQTFVFHPDVLSYRTTYRVSVAGFALGEHRLAAAGSYSFSTVGPPPHVPVPFTLTFDDCGTAAAIQSLLTVLADRGLQAIFFPTGKCRDQFPWLVPTLLAAGHRVCNHTYSHPDLTRLSDAAVRAEIQGGVQGTGCRLFRPPYGAVDRGGRIAAIAASFGYQLQLWDVDTRDWSGTPADVMDAMIRARGGVVLMHMHGAHSIDAVRML